MSIKVEIEGGPDEGADIMHSFSRILDRGRLLVPSPVTREVTLFVLNIWKASLKILGAERFSSVAASQERYLQTLCKKLGILSEK